MWLPCVGVRCTVHCRATCATPAFKRDKTTTSCPSLLSTLFCLTNLHLEHFFWAEVKIRCLTAAEGSKMSREVTFQVGLEKSNLLSDFKEKQKQIWFYAMLLQWIKSTVTGDLWPPEQTSQPNLSIEEKIWDGKYVVSREDKKIKGGKKLEKTKFGQNPDKG